MKNELATKGDLQVIRSEIAEVKNELKGEILGLKKELHDFRQEFAGFKLENQGELGKLRVEFNRNLYAVSLIQAITIIGTVLAIIFLRT